MDVAGYHLDEALRFWRDLHMSAQDRSRLNVGAIHGDVCVPVWLYDRSIQTDTCKRSPAARVGQNFCVHLDVSGGRSMPPHRARRGGGVSAHGKLVSQPPVHAAAVPE